MSKRSMLNVTSRKKRNDMLVYSNTTADGTITLPVNKQPLNVRGNSTFIGVWPATAMDLRRGGGYNTIADVAARTSTTCYMRGFSEKVRIQTSSAVPWFHRRICFTVTDSAWVSFKTSTTTYNNYVDIPGEGMQRAYRNLAESSELTPLTDYYLAVLFKGLRDTDWNDFMTARVDDKRVKVKYDKVRTITSGNQSGTVRSWNFWHPMNSNLTYDDDVSGEETATTNYWAAETNQKMGNYIVVDIIQPGAGAGATDLLRLVSESTLYWHEK